MSAFDINKRYTKNDIYNILGVAEDKRGGDWDTGCTKYQGSYYIFANIGVPGSTGHDYNNVLNEQNDELVWYARYGSRLHQPRIREMLSGGFTVHIFTRSAKKAPFTYLGTGAGHSPIEGGTVQITWEINIPINVPPQNIALSESDDDSEKGNEILYRRYRKGQRKLKQNLLKVYNGKCCITGCSIENVLHACHLEAHHIKGNNHSTNGLLLRADIHALLDDNLIGIDPGSFVIHINDRLIGTEYSFLQGRVMASRTDGLAPCMIILSDMWAEFRSVKGRSS